MIERILIFIAFLLIIEFMALRAILKLLTKKSKRRKTIKYYILFSGFLILISLIYYIYNLQTVAPDHEQFRRFFNLSALLLLNIAPKILLSIICIIDDVFRVIFVFIQFLLKKELKNIKICTRIILLSSGLFLALLLEVKLIYGIVQGKSEITINRININNNKLPKSFNGFKIAHISDFHLGSFHNTSLIEEAIGLLQQEKPDAIMFTGDMVNNEATEAKIFVPFIKLLKPPHGMYSVLGNHDMGDYRRWYNEREKACNLKELVRLQEEMGFMVLRNQHSYVVKGNDSIAVIGVDNWGEPPFKKYGDLFKATDGLDSSTYSILLSHDPSHWKNEVIPSTNIALTLSGHTHGFQFAVKLGNYSFSPVQFKYKEWGGLYHQEEQYLYVNTGLGFIGFPGRVGVKPEITIINLQKE